MYFFLQKIHSDEDFKATWVRLGFRPQHHLASGHWASFSQEASLKHTFRIIPWQYHTFAPTNSTKESLLWLRFYSCVGIPTVLNLF